MSKCFRVGDLKRRRRENVSVCPALLPGHVDTNTPSLSTPRELQRFLGMINFYRRFLLGAANNLCPLTEAPKGNPKVLFWTTEMQAATTTIKAALVAAVPL